MDRPKLYAKHSMLQKRDNEYTLDRYSKLVRWKKFPRILDIGCGEGATTLDVLEPRVPQDYVKLLGSDLQEKMVSFARNANAKSKVDFMQLDIATEQILLDQYDHIFSFFTFHWVANLSYLAEGCSMQEIAWNNYIGITTAHCIIKETCTVLWNILQPLVLPQPTQESLEIIEKEYFKKWNIPNCIGALDGKHIEIQCPKYSGSTYFSYKKSFRKGFKNTFDMLSPGGDMLINLVGDIPYYDLLKELLEHPIWASYFSKTMVPPFHSCKDPVKTLRTLLEDIGFTYVKIFSEQRTFYYENWVDCLKSLLALDPIISKLDGEQRQEYIVDFFFILKDTFGNCEEANGTIMMPYNLLVVYASKPE